jgi:hypothetical protein
MALDPQQAEKHLLHEIGYVCGIAQTRREIAAEFAAVLSRNLGDKRLFLVSLQWSLTKTSS